MNSRPILRSTSRPSTSCTRNVCRSFTPCRYLHPSTTRLALASQPLRTDERHEEPDKPPRNPLDPITLHRLEESRRAYYARRSYYAGAGAVICMLVPLLIVMNVDLEDLRSPKEKTDASESSNASFQGKPVVVAPGGAKIVAHDEKTGEDTELVPTGTSTIPHFPKTIRIPSSKPGNEEDTEYTLLGLGIRTVSFLRIEVYVVGLYVQTSSLQELQASLVHYINPIASALIPQEKEKLRQALLDPEESYRIWDTVLREKGSALNTAVRIVPVKNTDFQHLRDGWVRGITQRMKDASMRGDTQYSNESFGTAMKEFKALFGGKGRAPKGSVLLLKRDGDGTLAAIFQEREGKGPVLHIGEVKDERIARQIWLGYLGGQSVSSEGARRAVADGVMALVERPVGTVETQVT